MKLTAKQLRSLVKEVVKEAMFCSAKENKIDQDKDVDNYFDDVKMARINESGMSH